MAQGLGWDYLFLCEGQTRGFSTPANNDWHRLRILKRRLAWLIGEWISAEEDSARLDIVWQILIHLLSERGESSDRAVNLAAATAIKEGVDVRPKPRAVFI